jgi:hypothetical protein
MAQGIPVHRVNGGINTSAFLGGHSVRTVAVDYLTALSEGLFDDRELFSLTAHSAVINTADQAFWSVAPGDQTEYVWPAAGAVVTVESDDATDDVGNTGATEITVEGLLDDYSETTEAIATDGATPVAGLIEFFRINNVYVSGAGTGGKNAGNITIKQGANILSYINAGENKSEQLIYTVPLGKSLSIKKMLGSGAGNKNVHIHVYKRLVGGLFLSENHRSDMTVEGALITNP